MKKTDTTVKNYPFIFYLLFFLITSPAIFSQEKKEDIFYPYKKNWDKAKNIDEAAYFMQIISENDTTYICRYYNKYGPLIRQEVYLDSELTIPNGRFCWYDAKGNLDSTGLVCRKKKDGNWNYYDDSLNLVYCIVYDKGHFVRIRSRSELINNSIYSNGQTGNSDEQQPEAATPKSSNVNQGWQDYLKKNIKLPERFLSIFKTGIYPITVSFDINNEGTTDDIYLIRSCEWSADAEVFKAISKSPAWRPAVKSGDETGSNEKTTISFAPAFQFNGNGIENILPLSSINSIIIITQGSLNEGRFIDTAAFYKKIKPEDNFYLHVNGIWLNKHPLPASKYHWSNSDILHEINLERLNELYHDAAMHAPANSPERLLGDLYLSAMDSSLIEAKGYSPIKDELVQLESLDSKNSILKNIALLQTADGIGNCLFNFRTEEDDKNPDKYVVAFYQAGISLPVVTYYYGTDGRSEYVRNAYLKYINDMFKLAGFSKNQANSKANDVLELETAISNHLVTGEEIINPEKAYHKYAVSDFVASTQIDWEAVLSNLQINIKATDSILVNSPSYFTSIHSLMDNYPLKDWIAYMQWMLINNTAPYLNDAIVNRKFAFSKILNGQQEEMPHWSRATNTVNVMLDDISGKLFVDRYFSDSTKKRVTEMVDNLQDAFAQRIKQLSWMSDAGKHAALGKLHAISKNIGYPGNLSTYKGLVIRPDDFVGNIRRIKNWYYQSMISLLTTPSTTDNWPFPATTVNALYYPEANAIFLPAGILQPPFFDITADDAINYGSIGSVIAHELTHGFDSRGSQYDKHGRLFRWWGKEDASNFREKVGEIVDEYNKLKIDFGIYVNGPLTINENIADIGGLAIAYDAFKKTPQGQSSDLIDGLTPDQRFFISYAQNWRCNATAETTYQDNMIEPHAPEMYRCNVPLSNLDAFYQAFNIQKGDDMFKSANKRISIW